MVELCSVSLEFRVPGVPHFSPRTTSLTADHFSRNLGIWEFLSGLRNCLFLTSQRLDLGQQQSSVAH